MTKIKLLGKRKQKKESFCDTESTAPETTQENDKTNQESQKDAHSPILVYDETLHTADSQQKKTSLSVEESEKNFRRTSWENASTIEKNVDAIVLKHTEKKKTSTKTTDVNAVVDRLLTKKKKSS